MRRLAAALAVGGVAATLVLVFAPRPETSPEGEFCRLALTIFDVGQVTYATRDQNADGPGTCDIDDPGLYADTPIIDYDCTVVYPQNWDRSRIDRVEPSDVGGYCGNIGPDHRLPAAVVGAATAGLALTVSRIRRPTGLDAAGALATA